MQLYEVINGIEAQSITYMSQSYSSPVEDHNVSVLPTYGGGVTNILQYSNKKMPQYFM